MIWYHGTSREIWEKIKQEGVLYGRRFITNNTGTILQECDRCTYLASDLEEAKYYGDVVLEVDYDPYTKRGKQKRNNYCKGCWQMRVYEPIPLSDVRVVLWKN